MKPEFIIFIVGIVVGANLGIAGYRIFTKQPKRNEMIFRKEPEEKLDDLKKFVLKLYDEQGLKMEYMSRSFKNNVKILSYDRCGMWDGELIVYARDEAHFNEIIELARRNQ
jgi:hypothetical protein